MQTYLHRIINSLCLILATSFVASGAFAEIARDPIGVNVSAAQPMSLTVRFADTNGVRFTTTEALFCYRLLENGQCDPGAILGKLPSNRDRGSTLTPTSSITDVMTIPYSVIRSTVVIAQQVDFSDFYYVRRFVPEAGGDLGAGVDQAVFQRVTCHLAGPARVPLSLTRVVVYGDEVDRSSPVRLIRLDNTNLRSGSVMARVQHTGTGVLEGWWEVRNPHDPRLTDIDLLPEAALPPAQRAMQQSFQRIKKFRVPATTAGEVVIAGPRYDQLPKDISGRHEILLRFAATTGRENRASLAVDGEPLNLFSGAVAGFSIPPLVYFAPAAIVKSRPLGNLTPRLLKSEDDEGQTRWKLAWRAMSDQSLVVHFSVSNDADGARKQIAAPATLGVLDLPSSWNELVPADKMIVQLMDSSGETVELVKDVRVESEY